MNILLKGIGWICVVWVALCSIGLISFLKEGKISEAIMTIIIFQLPVAFAGFYAFKNSKKYTVEGKRKSEEERILLEQQNEEKRKQDELKREQTRKEFEEYEIKSAKEKAEKERLETEQKEKEFQEFKDKYPNHWQNILDKKLALDMTLEMVNLILGGEHNRKESVTKTKTTEKYNFHPYQNAQKKTSYKLEVTFENGLVTGWKEL